MSKNRQISLRQSADWHKLTGLTGYSSHHYRNSNQFGWKSLGSNVYNRRNMDEARDLNHCTMTDTVLQKVNSSFAVARANVTVHLFECMC